MSLHELTDEQREIRDLARRFADEVVAPQAAAWDREHRFPKEVFAQLGRARAAWASASPRSSAAPGRTSSPTCSCWRSSPAPTPGVGVTVAVHTSAATLPILAHGTPRAGRAARPAAGPGARAGGLRADRGRARAATRARCARARRRRTTARCSPAPSSGSPTARTPTPFLVFARDPAAGDRPSAFVVRRGAAGFAVLREEEKLGLQLVLDRGPRASRTRPPSASASRAPGCASRSPRSTAGGSASPRRPSGSRRRRSTSRPATRRSAARSAGAIGGFQAIQQKLADMQTEIEAARALTLARRAPEGGRAPAHRRGRAGEAVRLPRRAALDRRGDPGPRRLRLHQGVPGRALLPRREGHRDLRGHQRDPAPRDRPGAARRRRPRGLIAPPRTGRKVFGAPMAKHRSDVQGG